MTREGFGLRAYERRKELDLQRSFVAKKAGIDYQNLSKIENGVVKCPLGKTASALAEVLETTVSYLVDGVGFPDSVDESPRKSIPVLNWKETKGWCKAENNKLSKKERQYIKNPTEYFEKDIFAVKIQSDFMQSTTGNGFPRGCWVICRPIDHINPDKIIIFYDEKIESSFLRAVNIEEKTYLTPLNPQYSELTKELTDNIFPIAEVIGTVNLFQGVC